MQMTWSQFKQWVEERGVLDDDEIDYINVKWPGPTNVYRDEAATEPGSFVVSIA